jgi:hypothetical protein
MAPQQIMDERSTTADVGGDAVPAAEHDCGSLKLAGRQAATADAPV